MEWVEGTVSGPHSYCRAGFEPAEAGSRQVAERQHKEGAEPLGRGLM